MKEATYEHLLVDVMQVGMARRLNVRPRVVQSSIQSLRCVEKARPKIVGISHSSSQSYTVCSADNHSRWPQDQA